MSGKALQAFMNMLLKLLALTFSPRSLFTQDEWCGLLVDVLWM